MHSDLKVDSSCYIEPRVKVYYSLYFEGARS